MSLNYTSQPLQSGTDKRHKPKPHKHHKQKRAKPKRRAKTHRKTSSNPFGSRNRTKSQNIKYASYEQEQDGSSIFHELDPSLFPLTKTEALWMESSASEICCICLEKIDAKLFGTKKRHCKKCGRVVCIPCSDIRIRKHRVCTQCNKYYLSLNNILNQWYRTNRNINHSLCGYDSYTLDTCSNLKRILFLLNHYHQCILLNMDPDGQMSTKREIRRFSTDRPPDAFVDTDRAKVRAPFDITHVPIKDFVDRLPKYDSSLFLNDIHHLKQMHFKKSEVFKISQYQKNHQWELRAYSWKKIGKCDRWGCQYGIADVRKKDKKNNKKGGEHKEDANANANGDHKGSLINLDNMDIPTLLNNMHVVLLHGVDDEDEGDKKDITQKELYDLLPTTPMSPHTALSFFAATNRKMSADELHLDVSAAQIEALQPAMTEGQSMLLAIESLALADIEWVEQRHDTLCYWLDACCFRFDFFSTCTYEWEAIQKKKQILSDILDYLDISDHIINIWKNEHILKSIMKMVRANLFRSLPLTFRMLLNTPDYCQEDDSEEFEDPNYPHLCYVYEIALMLVRNIAVDDKSRKRYLGKTFIIPLTELFASEDVREREYLKAILHGIYARNMRLRRLIRSQMSNCCFRVIYTEIDNIENGISECLQLVCSIIQGLTIPIKQEYKNILYSVLIPLHKANSRKLHKFHETLLACCIQFILKDLAIGLDILTGLIKYWPHQSAAKSDMFLKEVVIIINTMMTDIDTVAHDDDDDDPMEKQKKLEIKNVFKYRQRGQVISAQVIDKIVDCMISDNHCLSEKALLAFGEVGVQKLMDMNKERVWPRVVNILFDNRDHKRHWCIPLHDSFQEALDTFIIRDAKMVSQIESMYKRNKNKNQNYFKNGYNPIYPSPTLIKNNKQRLQKYKQIQIMAMKNKHKLPKHSNNNKEGFV